MSNMEISRVLNEMRALQSRVSGAADFGQNPSGVAAANSAGTPPADFASLMKTSVDKVAQMQNDAQALSTAYETGDKSVDLTKVMLEVQKAGLAFRAMTEVRNKLLDAYSQVMNMQV